ncbi:hypothetical protein DPMN_034916 [Dreissena polymorpha]|uniref:Secreted protein n=1 Tax=Dreissena polymorpha TaxID=45954 RepID=A0A9D4M8I9_DREPO|nr:hypothetical protein DPMN_034916 [Dreissena polymorpha]
MASLLRLHCVLTASIATLLRLWRSYCDPSASLEHHKPGRWCDGMAKNSIFTENVIGVLTTTIKNFQKHSLRSP